MSVDNIPEGLSPDYENIGHLLIYQSATRHNESCCDLYNIRGVGGGVWNTITAWRDIISLFYFDQILKWFTE